jgi:CBS domain-containing protein
VIYKTSFFAPHASKRALRHIIPTFLVKDQKPFIWQPFAKGCHYSGFFASFFAKKEAFIIPRTNDNIMLVRELMNKKVVTADYKLSLRDAVKLMVDNHIGSVIVTKNSVPVGILTDRDVLVCISDSECADLDAIKLDDIVTLWIITITPESTVEKAVDVMTKNNIKRLPVLKNERIVGIITASDILAAKPIFVGEFAKMICKRKP